MVKSRLRPNLTGERRTSVPNGIVGLRCDFCGGAFAKGERRRLTWRTAADGDFVLAELCPRCASDPNGFLHEYGGRGRASLRIIEPATADRPRAGVIRSTSGIVLRASMYILIALATFFIVTLITTHH
jgi:hypothetical protein